MIPSSLQPTTPLSRVKIRHRGEFLNVDHYPEGGVAVYHDPYMSLSGFGATIDDAKYDFDKLLQELKELDDQDTRNGLPVQSRGNEQYQNMIACVHRMLARIPDTP